MTTGASEGTKGNASATVRTHGTNAEAARDARQQDSTGAAGLSNGAGHVQMAPFAQAYHNRGLAVIPILSGEKRPAIDAWQERRLTLEDLAPYLTDGRYGLGIVTGQLSGNLAILDFDRDGWAVAYEHFCHCWPQLDESHAPTVKTGSGRRHVWLRCPAMPADYTRQTFERPDLSAAIELRGNRCQSLAPPSIHPSGNRYEWATPEKVELPAVPFAELRDWLADWAGITNTGAAVPFVMTAAMQDKLRAAGYTQQAIDQMTPAQAWQELGGIPATPGPASPIPDTIPQGQRNATLTSLAGSMRRRGATEPAILAALQVENLTKCNPPLPEDDLAAIAHSVARYEPAATQAPAEPVHLTDLGNAERLVAIHGRDLLYCHTWGTWLVWDGIRWAKDQTQEVERRAVGTVRTMYADAAGEQDPERRKALATWALRSESIAHQQGMLRLAQSQRPAVPDQFDADGWLLNVQNGTLDLRTGDLRPHNPEDQLTKLAPVTYDPAAQCPLWERFLDRIMAGDRTLIEFLQVAAGYSLTADTREQCFFILHGSGANGKSTFMETLAALLGDYAQTTAPDTLLTNRFDSGIPNDVARLRGARLVTTAEVGDGRRLAEAKVKQMTGGDTITARFMRSEFFAFRPEYKLWLATNHKPAIRGTDLAIWRRIRLVPFKVSIPPAEQDKTLAGKLQAELPGILNWALTGCLTWQASGLPEPEAVRRATGDYRAEMDVLAHFLADRCDMGDGLQVEAKPLYDAYVLWCQANGEDKATSTAFGRQLTERGIEKYRRSTGNVYIGLALKP